MMSLHINRTVAKMPDFSSTSSPSSSVCVGRMISVECLCMYEQIAIFEPWFICEGQRTDVWGLSSLFLPYWGMISPIISALLHTYTCAFSTWDSGRFSSLCLTYYYRTIKIINEYHCFLLLPEFWELCSCCYMMLPWGHSWPCGYHTACLEFAS